MLTTIKRLVSKWTGSTIPAGYGTTVDDGMSLKSLPTNEMIEKSQRSTGIVYQLRSPKEVGGFEVLDIIKGNGGVSYRLIHPLTGTQFRVNKKLFEILFQSNKESSP